MEISCPLLFGIFLLLCHEVAWEQSADDGLPRKQKCEAFIVLLKRAKTVTELHVELCKSWKKGAAQNSNAQYGFLI